MAKKQKTIEKESKGWLLITTEGKEISVEYDIDPDIADFVLEEAQEALWANSIWCPEDWIEIKFGEAILSEIDMKKIIGINWF